MWGFAVLVTMCIDILTHKHTCRYIYIHMSMYICTIMYLRLYLFIYNYEHSHVSISMKWNRLRKWLDDWTTRKRLSVRRTRAVAAAYMNWWILVSNQQDQWFHIFSGTYIFRVTPMWYPMWSVGVLGTTIYVSRCSCGFSVCNRPTAVEAAWFQPSAHAPHAYCWASPQGENTKIAEATADYRLRYSAVFCSSSSATCLPLLLLLWCPGFWSVPGHSRLEGKS